MMMKTYITAMHKLEESRVATVLAALEQLLEKSHLCGYTTATIQPDMEILTAAVLGKDHPSMDSTISGMSNILFELARRLRVGETISIEAIDHCPKCKKPRWHDDHDWWCGESR
jgi:hypothetical protein